MVLITLFSDVSKYNDRLSQHARRLANLKVDKYPPPPPHHPDVDRDTSFQSYTKFTALIFFKLQVSIFIVVAAMILTECHCAT